MDSIQRYTGLVSSNSGTVGVTAVQVSGKSTGPLTAVSATYYPSYHRMGLIIANTSAGTIYAGSLSSITAGNGGGWFKEIGSGQFLELMRNGSVPIWLIGSGASLSFTIDEFE